MSDSALLLDRTSLHTIGNEATKIARTERVFRDPEAIIARASTQRFAHINPHYPGVRAAVDGALLKQLCAAVATVASRQLGYQDATWTGQAWYSIVTHAPAQLTPIQRLPHFDGFDPNQLAVMIYLNQTGHGGTGFYRHKATGFETVTQPRYQRYKSHLEQEVRAAGLPAQRYISDGAPHFQLISDLGAEMNSMITYPGVALHSGLIDNALPLSPIPNEGRLTINGFFMPRASLHSKSGFGQDQSQ